MGLLVPWGLVLRAPITLFLLSLLGLLGLVVGAASHSLMAYAQICWGVSVVVTVVTFEGVDAPVLVEVILHLGPGEEYLMVNI